MSFFKTIKEKWVEFWDLSYDTPWAKTHTPPAAEPGAKVETFHLNALVIVFNPTDAGQDNRRLNEILGWNNVDGLLDGYISDLKQCSHGIANYEIVDTIHVNEFPVKQDGFRYEMQGYLQAHSSRQGFHNPDLVDYEAIIDQFNLVERINRREMDEVWLFGFPYAGFYESRMVGPGAFFCNAPPLDIYPHCLRRFVIMGFNYERGVGEMLESMGHRAEFTMSHIYGNKETDANLWRKYCRIERTHPDRSEVGTVHFAPNSRRDYDWGHKQPVISFSRNWRNFPDLSGTGEKMDCSEWGNGDIRQHHLWWFNYIPHQPGQTDGISNNWWEYILDPDRVE